MTPDCVAQISVGVVLDPSGLRENLPEFLLRDRADRPGMVEHERAGAGRALVEGKYEGHGESDRIR